MLPSDAQIYVLALVQKQSLERSFFKKSLLECVYEYENMRTYARMRDWIGESENPKGGGGEHHSQVLRHIVRIDNHDETLQKRVRRDPTHVKLKGLQDEMLHLEDLL